MQLSRGRTPGVKLQDNAERNRVIISMYLAGFRPETIRHNINKQSEIKSWGPLATERSIWRIISEYFKGKPMSAAEAKAYDFGLRQAALARHQGLYEELAIDLREKKRKSTLAPYEFQYSIKAMSNINQKLIDNMGWNASKKGSDRFSRGETQMEVFDRCRQEVTENEEARQELIEYIDSFLDEQETA